MRKILELKREDWLKGYSQQGGIPMGGIFEYATNFNPFERMGFLQPSLSPVELTAPADAVKVLNSFNNSSTGYFYAHTDTKLYQYLSASPYTQVDKSAEINVTNTIGGAIIWGNKYIYAQSGILGGISVYSNSLPVASANNVEIMANASSSLVDVRHMCVGADKNLYIGGYEEVGKITNPAGTSGNTYNFFAIDAGFTVRALINDGRNLIILADNNAITTTSRVVGAYRCRVYVWDMGKVTADAIYDIEDSYLIGGAFLDGAVYIFGYNGVYVCNEATPPRMIFSFRDNTTIVGRPKSPYHITKDSQAIYWVDAGSIGTRVYGIRNGTFFQPYVTHNSTPAQTSIMAIDNKLIVGTDAPKLYIHNTGETRGTSVVLTANEVLTSPHTYDFTKVVLRSPMSSGQSIDIVLNDSHGTVIANTVTRSYLTDGAKKVLTFRSSLVSSSPRTFEDIGIYIASTGAVVERVAVYATPLEDSLQQ